MERIAALPAWVIDGNYFNVAAPRLRAADTLIYLDVPRAICMGRILRRIVVGSGRVRIDLPAGCPEQFDPTFLRFAWAWHRDRRPATLAFVNGFAGRKIILSGRHALGPVIRS